MWAGGAAPITGSEKGNPCPTPPRAVCPRGPSAPWGWGGHPAANQKALCIASQIERVAA